MLTVYTSTIGYKGADRLDITVKSAKTGKFLAPTRDMVVQFRKKTISESEYKEQYFALMRASYKKYRTKWDALLRQNRVTLVCYCKPRQFCHRLLLAGILEELGAEYKGEIPA